MTTTCIQSKSDHISNANLLQKPRIKAILDFKACNALIDITNGDIFLSSKIKDVDNITNVINDEFAHYYTKSADHNDKWIEYCKEEYDSVPTYNPEFDKLRRRLGIDKNIGGNIGNITGIQNLLLDYHLLQAYRKFSQRILGTEGRWEVKGNNMIRLTPVPRGTYPVLVEYFPAVTKWRTPVARELIRRLVIAEASIIIGNIRSKRALPLPEGGSTTFGGEQLVERGYAEREKVYQDALKLGEPPGIYAM